MLTIGSHVLEGEALRVDVDDSTHQMIVGTNRDKGTLAYLEARRFPPFDAILSLVSRPIIRATPILRASEVLIASPFGQVAIMREAAVPRARPSLSATIDLKDHFEFPV